MTEIVTLTINPAIDIFVNVARVEPTRKLRCSPPKRDPGGGGINVARVAHRLGGDVTAIYPIGGQIGKLLQRLLEREDVASLVTPSHVETRENFTAYEESTGKQYRFVLPGSPLHRAEWEAVLDRLASLAERPKFVVASGSVPPGAPDDFFARVARHAKALGAKSRDRHVGHRACGSARRRRHHHQAKPSRADGIRGGAARPRRGPHRRLPQTGGRRAG